MPRIGDPWQAFNKIAAVIIMMGSGLLDFKLALEFGELLKLCCPQNGGSDTGLLHRESKACGFPEVCALVRSNRQQAS